MNEHLKFFNDCIMEKIGVKDQIKFTTTIITNPNIDLTKFKNWQDLIAMFPELNDLKTKSNKNII